MSVCTHLTILQTNMFLHDVVMVASRVLLTSIEIYSDLFQTRTWGLMESGAFVLKVVSKTSFPIFIHIYQENRYLCIHAWYMEVSFIFVYQESRHLCAWYMEVSFIFVYQESRYLCAWYMEVSFLFVFLYLCIEKPDICALDRWKIHSWQTRVRRKWLGWRSVGGWREYNGGSHINCYSALPSII